MYLSSIQGNNIFNNKSINLNYNDFSSNEIKNNRVNNTNNKINIKFLKKIEKEKQLNKSTNIEDNPNHILQSDYRSMKNNYINEESKIKNININLNLNLHKENNNDILTNVKSVATSKKNSKKKAANSSNKRQGIININNNINILSKMVYVNSRSKKRKKSGLEEKLNKIFKERFSVSLKKNNSKGKDAYMKTGVHIGGYTITKSKSPSSYSHEKGDINSVNKILGINNKKIKQNYLIGINNKYINQNFGNNNYSIKNNNINLVKTFNNNIYINNINSINQKPVATPMNKNNLNKKMSIGFPVNFSNVKRKILSKEKNKNNNINNINNIINNMNGNSNKFANNNRVEFNSTHHSKEKNYGTIKSNSQNKKSHHGSKNKNKTKNNFININSINLNS